MGGFWALKVFSGAEKKNMFVATAVHSFNSSI
jgi:hypothetical protein